MDDFEGPGKRAGMFMVAAFFLALAALGFAIGKSGLAVFLVVVAALAIWSGATARDT